MDMYSYDPNSRIARRKREKERKKKRNRRILIAALILLVAVAVAFFVAKRFDGADVKFDVVSGFNRLVNTIRPVEEKQENKENEPIVDNTSEDEELFVDEPDELIQTVPATNVGYYPSPEIDNNLLNIFKNAQGESEKICCLTFDDGPNASTTPEILDILKQYNVKATFFELGEKLATNKELARRTFDEGHLLANHTYTQKYSTIYSDWNVMLEEIENTSLLIGEITGEEPYRLVRMPGGSFNSGVYGAVKQEYREKLAENGYYYIDWNVDSGDNGKRSSAEILAYIKDYCGSKPVVLLFEDNNSRKAGIKALPSVIEYLQGCGYVFKRLDEIKYFAEEDMPSQTQDTPKQLFGIEIFARGSFNI